MKRWQWSVEQTVLIVLAAIFVALSAQFSFPIPGTPIPQTGQTVAVLICGALLGPGRGGLAIMLYLLMGAAGLPVFSEGGSGWAVLTGVSAGYFAGFVLAAVFLGMAARRRQIRYGMQGLLVCVLFMMAGHLLILLAGWGWMALELGPFPAYESGVQPFYYGGFVKSVIAAVVVVLSWQAPVKWRLALTSRS